MDEYENIWLCHIILYSHFSMCPKTKIKSLIHKSNFQMPLAKSRHMCSKSEIFGKTQKENSAFIFKFQAKVLGTEDLVKVTVARDIIYM